MKHQNNTRGFASRWGFILASVGSAVGMANVWGFPHKLGSNGGGAFLLIYLLFIVIFSYVGLPAEFAMGRRAETGTLGAYRNAWATRGKKAGKAGGILGWLPLAGSLCIAIGYAVIVTYTLKALVDSVTGTLLSADAASWFASFSEQPFSVVPYHIIVVVGTLLTLFLGAKSIEKNPKSNMMKLLWRVISFEREMVSQADQIKRECVFVCTKCSQSYILFFCAIYRKKGKKQQFMPVKCHWCQRY